MTNYVSYSPDKHEIVVSGLPINRLRTRISESYRSISGYSQIKGSSLFNIFNKMEYITWNTSEVRFFSFFALEVYEMFADLSEKYNDDMYRDISEEIYKKTWISNFETKEKIKMPLNKLSMFQFTPKDFQREFIEQYSTLKYQYDLDGYILSFDQGLGKTLTSIILAECLNKEHVYIICPNALKMVWANEIKKYYKKYSDDENLWKSEVFVSGTNMAVFHSSTTKFFIVNQESIQNIFPYVSSKKNNMIIVDEVQNFRGMNAKRVDLLLTLKEMSACHDCLLMSGTPIKALPNEMVPALRVVDPHFTKELADIYFKTFSDKSTESANIVRERFRRVIYRKLKKDVNIDFPDKFISEMRLKIPHPERFGINKAKAEILDYYHAEYLNRLKTGIFTTNKKSIFYRSSPGNYNFKNEQTNFENIVRKYSRAHSEKTEYYLNYIFQRTEDKSWELINSHNVDRKYFDFLKKFVIPYMPVTEGNNLLKNINGILGWSIAAKSASASAIGTIITALKNECFNLIWDFNYNDIIEQILKNKKKTIIFTTQVPIADHISESLTKNNIKNVKVTGIQSRKDDLVDIFKSDNTVQCMVATVQTLGKGQTLNDANQIFFFGCPYRAADFNQAIDRVHRIGQDSSTYVYNVLLYSRDKNITDRIEEIMEWSGELVDAIMNEKAEDITLLENIYNTYGNNKEKLLIKKLKEKILN